MKIYDCFPFYNEFELLELRLKALWDVVDVFVIVEADKTHTNKPKPFYFWERQDEFKEFFPKIRHLPVEMTMPYNGVGDWSIENAQRDAIIYGLDDADPDDLIMISDADEIPAPDILHHLNDFKLITLKAVVPIIGNKQQTFPAQLLMSTNEYLEIGPLALIQKFHYYYFDLLSDLSWMGTVLVKRKNLTSPQEMRVSKNILLCADGGHHFSYMGGVDRVINKMTSIVDGNEIVVNSGGKLIDRAHVEQSIAQGTDVYNRKDDTAVEFTAFDARSIKLPHVDEFLKKYPHFLREPEKYFANWS